MTHFKTCVKPLFTALLLVSVLGGCVRYTTPMSEMNKKSKDGTTVLDSQEFAAHEKSLADKLARLVESRKGLDALAGQNAYVVGIGDVLTLNVFGFPNLSTETEVSADGTISVPMVGEGLHAAGQTLGDLKITLVKQLKRYVNDPRIQLTVKDYQASKVFVVGEVAKPGTYALKRSGEQLLELISEAGGRTQDASGRVILVPANAATAGSSANGNGSSGVEISIDDLIGNADSRPIQIALVAGDTVIVPEAGSVEVFGEVDKPGSYKLASRTSALGAIASAGGFTYAAKVNEVEIIRDIGGGKKASMAVNLEDVALKGYTDVRLRDGDVIRVPSESGSFFRRQVVDVINGTFRGVGVNAR